MRGACLICLEYLECESGAQEIVLLSLLWLLGSFRQSYDFVTFFLGFLSCRKIAESCYCVADSVASRWVCFLNIEIKHKIPPQEQSHFYWTL